MKSSRRGLFVLCGVVFAAAGCGARETATPTATPPAEAGSDAAVETPPVEDNHPALGPNLLFNGSFELWDKHTLKGWAAAQGVGPDWTNMAVQRVKGLHPRTYAVSLPEPPAEHYAILAQNVAKRWIETGKTLYFGAVIHAEHPFQAQIVLTYRAGGVEHKERAVHPGDGTWASVYGSVTVPDNADPDSFRVELFRNPGSDGNVWMDDAGLAYTIDANAAPAESTAPTEETE